MYRGICRVPAISTNIFSIFFDFFYVSDDIRYIWKFFKSKIFSFFFVFFFVLDESKQITNKFKSIFLKRKRGGLIIQSRDYAVVQRRCCLCNSSCRQSTSAALNTLLSAVRFQVWQTRSKSYRYNPTIYETTIKRRIEWYNQINEIPIIKRKFFLSKIFCLEKIYFRFFLNRFFRLISWKTYQGSFF